MSHRPGLTWSHTVLRRWPQSGAWATSLIDSIEKGGVFDVRIEQGIRTSSLVAAVLTPSSVGEKSVCRKEIIFALNEGKQIIPLLAQRAVKPSLMLADLNWKAGNQRRHSESAAR
jgi:hypothetical protein